MTVPQRVATPVAVVVVKGATMGAESVLSMMLPFEMMPADRRVRTKRGAIDQRALQRAVRRIWDSKIGSRNDG
jgi:hypothetical protein